MMKSSSLDAFVSALTGNNVYSETGATQISGQVSSNFVRTDVAFASFDPVSFPTYNPNQLANMLAERLPQYDTIIVVVDKSFGVSTSGDASAILNALNTELATTDNVSDAILNSQSVIKNQTITSTGDGSVPPDGEGIGVVGIGGITLGLAALGTAAVLAYRRFAGTITKNTTTQISYDKLPEDLKRELQAFRNLVHMHSAANNQALSIRLQSILGNVQELFRRIDRKGTEAQRRMAGVEYVDTLQKLNKALGEDYYLDIVAHPDLWDNAQRRMSEVRDAVLATDTQIVQNIRQVNASQDLDFQVALESLTRSMATVTAQDMMNTNTKDNS